MDAEALLLASSVYARFVLGGIFLWAGVAKLRRRTDFERAIVEIAVLPREAVPSASRVIPVTEITIGMLLVVGLWTEWAAITAVLLLVGFTALSLVKLQTGHRSTCFCFGSSDDLIGGLTVYRNLSLIAVAGLILSATSSPFSADEMLGFRNQSYVPSPQDMSIVGLLGLQLLLAWRVIPKGVRLGSARSATSKKG